MINSCDNYLDTYRISSGVQHGMLQARCASRLAPPAAEGILELD